MLPAALLAVAFLEEYCKVRVWLLRFGIFTIFYKLTDKSWGTSTSSGRLQGESLGIVPSFKKSQSRSLICFLLRQILFQCSHWSSCFCSILSIHSITQSLYGLQEELKPVKAINGGRRIYPGQFPVHHRAIYRDNQPIMLRCFNVVNLDWRIRNTYCS